MGASEIVEYHPATRRVFVVNAEAARVSVLELSKRGFGSVERALDPGKDIPDFAAGSVTSVAVFGDLLAVSVGASENDRRGRVAFYDADRLDFLGARVVGFLPDMLTFTPDGRKLLVANEGEQVRSEDGRIVADPEGSVSIIDLSLGVARAAVAQATFVAFDARIEEFRAKGVRIPALEDSFFERGEGQISLSRDLEPEYIALSADGNTAWVTLQENDAIAVLDVAAAAFVDILPLGSKDHSLGQPSLENVVLSEPDRPVIGKTPSGQRIHLGGLSGLWFERSESSPDRKVFYSVADRGPHADLTDLRGDGRAFAVRPHVLPRYQAAIQRLVLEHAELRPAGNIPLFRSDGSTPITGKPNHPLLDPSELPVDTRGRALSYDSLGGDFEGILIDPRDQSFWLVDEYRPSIYNFDARGTLLYRFVPVGTAQKARERAGRFGRETLPSHYALRGPNRGFEAVALDPEEQKLYAFMQSPRGSSPHGDASSSDAVRIVVVDSNKASATFGAAIGEYVYLLEGSDYRESPVDKLGDAVFVRHNQLLVVERDSSRSESSKKLIFRIDLTGATNVLGLDTAGGKSLEQSTVDELVTSYAITPVHKQKLLNLPSLGYRAFEKVEGLALLDDGRLAVVSDNDFGLAPGDIRGDGSVQLSAEASDVALGLVSFTGPNGLDASDRDGLVNIRGWPVLGSYMPDGIEAFRAHGRDYLVTANEGDTRDYDESRVADLELDPSVFPDALALQSAASLGRLKVSPFEGDLDGDGDFDRLHAFGGRSLSVWDAFGNLVFDTGSLFEDVTARALPGEFNSNNDANASFDTRSDDKGPEPEGVEVGEVGGRTYAFVGLERIGGIVVLDLTEPQRVGFVEYVNLRDFAGGAELEGAGDLGPEGLKLVPAADSPTGRPLLLVGNEVSGTTSVYEVNL